MDKKLIIIGLDGGTFNIIDPLIKKGKLPFIDSLMKEGSHGILKSTIPPITAPAWTSFMTGKNPANHGLFDFERINPKTGKSELTYSNNCYSATLWNYLNEAGKKVILVNVPMTYPPKAIDGIVISGFPVPDNVNYVYPPHMYDYIQKLGYCTDWTKMVSKKKNIFISKVKVMKEIEKIRIKVFSELLSKHEWDVAMVVISGTDHISHREWQKGNRSTVENYYEYIDSLLSDFANKPLFRECSFVIVSDHGFTATDKMFYLNGWLHKEGYLFYKEEINKSYDKLIESLHKKRTEVKSAKILAKMGLTRNSLIYLAKRTGLIKLEKFLPKSLIDILPSRDIMPLWEETRAYLKSVASKGININLQGREEYGAVSKGHYETLRSEIIEKLRALKYNNEHILEIVEKREDVYKGLFIEEAPDITIWPGKGFNIRQGMGKKHYIEKMNDARHDMNGIVIFKGDFIKQDYTCNLNIEDIMPVLLQYSGLACPTDLNGKIVLDLFETDKKPELAQVSYRKPLLFHEEEKSFGKDEDSVISQLKALGYM